MASVKPSGAGSARAPWAAGLLLFIGAHPRARNMQALITFGRRIGLGYKVLAILVLNTLLIAAGLELASRALTDVRDAGRPTDQSAPDPREKSSYYLGKTWAPQYWREFKSSRKTQYPSYVVWRRAPLTGPRSTSTTRAFGGRLVCGGLVQGVRVRRLDNLGHRLTMAHRLTGLGYDTGVSAGRAREARDSAGLRRQLRGVGVRVQPERHYASDSTARRRRPGLDALLRRSERRLCGVPVRPAHRSRERWIDRSHLRAPR